MSRLRFWVVLTAAVALALAFRLAWPDARPMHHDEANQAVKFGTLLETGEYRYDRNDHHGPSLYYLTLPVAWARGQTTLASLDERTLRLVPALFGAGVILLLPLLAAPLGRGSVATSAVLVAVSPVLTYYSRYYIQESLLAFFAVAFLIAVGRCAERGRAGWAAAAGVFAGLAYATKETSVIVFATALVSCAVARAATAGTGAAIGTAGVTPGKRLAHFALGCAAALAIALVLYSSLLRHPAGLLESIRAFSIYADRGLGAGSHAEPSDYYLRLLWFAASGGLVWTEALVLLLAIAGSIFAFRNDVHGRFWPRYICLYSWITALAFSAIPYKTPWNVLPFYVGLVAMAGYGATAILGTVQTRGLRSLIIVVFLAATCHLALQDWHANFRYPADPRNPYAYAQTSPDFLRLVQRVTDLAALHPERQRMLIEVIAGPYEQWPLPWYLRGMARVGYWTRAADAEPLAGAPVIVASQAHAAVIDAALGERYVSEFYGLRPGVLLTVYIERSLWDRFLVKRQGLTF
ncbi:MAG TPA: flippase activity-associated protein Agl23 [Vicinamibacterales bacterium]|jgi:uncharacterized protein (TIGR03663 family)